MSSLDIPCPLEGLEAANGDKRRISLRDQWAATRNCIEDRPRFAGYNCDEDNEYVVVAGEVGYCTWILIQKGKECSTPITAGRSKSKEVMEWAIIWWRRHSSRSAQTLGPDEEEIKDWRDFLESLSEATAFLSNTTELTIRKARMMR